jgi:restriction endonuclease Mrr
MISVTVTIDNDWIEDGELEETFKERVIHNVVSQLYESLSKEHLTHLKKVSEEQIKKLCIDARSKAVNEFIEKGQVLSYYGSNKMVSVDERIREEFNSDRGYGSVKEYITNIAKNLSKEAKDRYDFYFASQIVNKLNEASLLKEGVYESLVNNNDKLKPK